MGSPWTDCPACPKCRATAGSSEDSETGRALRGTVLQCKACGFAWTGTRSERAQAERADAAWEAECQREERAEHERRTRAQEADWLSRAGSAARLAPEPRPADPSAQLTLPGVPRDPPR